MSFQTVFGRRIINFAKINGIDFLNTDPIQRHHMKHAHEAFSAWQAYVFSTTMRISAIMSISEHQHKSLFQDFWTTALSKDDVDQWCVCI